MATTNDNMLERLRETGLRPTRQRLALCSLLFGAGHRHVTAEQLYQEATQAQLSVSLATIYNTLNQFERAGLLKEIALDGGTACYDTDVSDHCHFYHEETGELFDLDATDIDVAQLPCPPKGTEIVGIDMVVRLRSKQSNKA